MDNIKQICVELANLAKRKHYFCEDSWYSCPKAEGGCVNDAEGDECTCGADAHNAKVNELLAAALTEPEPEAPINWAAYFVRQAVVQEQELKAALAEPESASLEQGVQQMQPFVVRHYTEDERPTIKGNGFDGLEIGEDREEAEAFVAWINEKLARLGNHSGFPDSSTQPS